LSIIYNPGYAPNLDFVFLFSHLHFSRPSFLPREFWFHWSRQTCLIRLPLQGEIYPNVSVPPSRDLKSQKFAPEKQAPLTGLAGLTQSWVDWVQQALSTDSSEVYPYRFDAVPDDVDNWVKSSDGIAGYIRSSINEIAYLLRLKKV
jgi:hypothetical protein